MEKTYWCVVSEFDGYRLVNAWVISRKHAKKPLNKSRENEEKNNVFLDWFDTEEAALQYMNDVAAAQEAGNVRV